MAASMVVRCCLSFVLLIGSLSAIDAVVEDNYFCMACGLAVERAAEAVDTAMGQFKAHTSGKLLKDVTIDLAKIIKTSLHDKEFVSSYSEVLTARILHEGGGGVVGPNDNNLFVFSKAFEGYVLKHFCC